MEDLDRFLLNLYDAIINYDVSAKDIQYLINDGEFRENEKFISVERLKADIDRIKYAMLQQKEENKRNKPIKKFLYIEDGSVDIDQIISELERTNPEIKVIVYRSGANMPKLLDVGE